MDDETDLFSVISEKHVKLTTFELLKAFLLLQIHDPNNSNEEKEKERRYLQDEFSKIEKQIAQFNLNEETLFGSYHWGIVITLLSVSTNINNSGYGNRRT